MPEGCPIGTGCDTAECFMADFGLPVRDADRVSDAGFTVDVSDQNSDIAFVRVCSGILDPEYVSRLARLQEILPNLTATLIGSGFEVMRQRRDRMADEIARQRREEIRQQSRSGKTNT